ncbi:unnamed protein product [Spirodela intermedia]|uniref:SPX domain-containing protein n=1 Tax=Spirodela intermedia TaxID=51605 RepID=A0A7I8J5B2_SPIIN|nr:unnamed protein product [Spirodela intermedia]CAA6665291.1 unnamed protein product [Spirodela intermedia]
MKFGKRLKRQVEETLPGWRDKFLSYKDLKRQGSRGGGVVRMLNAEVDKLNAFFIEQEEDFVIRHKEMRDRIRAAEETVGPGGARPSAAEYVAEMGKIRRCLVDLHGEMVLLVNYSNVNYTGLAKILKKYDKRTGDLLRLPFIEKVLTQPFFTTDLISQLVKECENTMDSVLPRPAAAEPGGEGAQSQSRAPPESVARWSILKNTMAALVTMQELRRGSSTYGHFSLPR